MDKKTQFEDHKIIAGNDFHIYPAALGVGAMCFDDNLEYQSAQSIYSFKPSEYYHGESLDDFIYRTQFKIYQGNLPAKREHIENFPFSALKVFVYGTCFHIGDGLIVTAGHNVFQEQSSDLKPHILKMKVILGLTQENINDNKVPQKWVFGIQSVLFGQNTDFAGIDKDRADWALLQLAPSAHGAQFPNNLKLELKPLVPTLAPSDATQIWLAGHPWGLGLTIVRPQDGGVAKIPAGAKHLFKHTLRIVPANSGGPILDAQNKCIGIAVSGKGDPVASRGFIYMGDRFVPFFGQTQFGGANICDLYALTRPTGHFILACELPAVDPPPPNGPPNTITVRVLYGEGDNQATWQSVGLVNAQLITQNNFRISVHVPFTQRDGQTWQHRVRALGFTYAHTAFTHVKSRGAVIPRVKNIVFGCFGDHNGGNVNNWTVLYRGDGPTFGMVPQAEIFQDLPVFIPQDWKAVDGNGLMGLFDTRNNTITHL